MARTFADYRTIVNHALGASPAAGVTRENIVNDALQHLAGVRSWRWLQAGPVRLNILGPITIEDGTWTEGTRTLTSTGSFANYVHATGDYIEITGGAQATPGFYAVESRTSDDAIVLTASIGSSADGDTDIDGTLPRPYVPLPDDFSEEYSVNYPSSFARNMIRSTLAEIEMLRADPINAADYVYRYAVRSGVQAGISSSVTSPQSSPDPLAGLSPPRLELYPEPPADVSAAIVVTYKRQLLPLVSETDVPLIPTWMEYGLELLIRAFAHTVEDANAASAAQQAFNNLLPELIRRDSNLQQRLGVMAGGLHPRRAYVDPFFPDGDIADPT